MNLGMTDFKSIGLSRYWWTDIFLELLASVT